MIIYSADVLENLENLRQHYCNKHPYVLVDEFQDISPADFRLIRQLSKNLFAVGDDDQAIYGFRGGDSEIMQTFYNRSDVSKYKITRNYRSTATIVRHAKALIEHNNPARICKNLHANNSVQSQVKIFKTPQKTEKVKEVLLRELSNLLTTDLKKVGILARNWKGEINDIQKILDFSELQIQGFEIDSEESGDLDKNRRKIILRRGAKEAKEIEILNIHDAKGREWDKVILLVNTVYDNLPDDRNDLVEERRLFYVAVTRAKQELVVLDGGNCQFIPEFQNVLPRQTELATQKHKPKIELQEVSKAALPNQTVRMTQVVISKEENIRAPERLDRVVEIYLTRLINFRFGPEYDLDKPAIKGKMAEYLAELDGESVKKINEAATIDTTEYINKQPLGNYCVGQATTYMCNDIVFRNFWNRMWQVVEQSKMTPKSK